MLRKKMMRDFWQHKSQFFSIFLMCFLSMFMYSGIYAEWYGMEHSVTTYYDESNLADAWLMGDVGDGAYLKDVPEVTAYEGRRKVSLHDEQVKDSVIDLYAVEQADISACIVLEGMPYDPKSEGIWLDQAYASANDLAVGDTISLTMQGNRIKTEIKGLVWQGEYVYALKDATTMLPDHKTYGYAFMAKQANAQLQNLPYNQIVIQSDTEDGLKKEVLEDLVKHKPIQVIDRESHPSVRTMQDEIDQHRSIGTLFPIIFLLIALLTTLNTMNKMIGNQRTQIGTLKALGFTNRRLYLHYMSHIILLCGLGTILGLCFGPLIIPELIFAMQETMYSLPEWRSMLDAQVFLLAGMSFLACLSVCYQAVHKEVKERAAIIMRPKVVRIYGKQRHSHSHLWRRLSFYTQWNLRDMVRNKARSSMAIAGVCGCMALLVGSLGLQDSIQKMITWQYEELHMYQNKILLKADSTDTEIQELKENVDGSGIQEGILTLDGKEKKMVPLSILEDTRYLKVNAEEPDTLLPEDGVIVAKKLADELDVQAGDTIRWQSNTDWHTSVIARIERVPLSQGITMSKSYYEKQEPYHASAILTNTRQIPASDIIMNVQNHDDLRKDMDVMLEAMQVIVMVLICAAAILGIVVLYNFTSLSFFERKREMATLKVIGFTNRKVKKLTIAQNMQFALIGICLGLPFGYAMIYFMAATLSEGMDLPVYISLYSLGIAILSTLCITYAISKLMAKKTSQIDMVSALKTVE